MKDGDIYRWHWKDMNRSSHCCSHLAVVVNGSLLDTFWSVGKNRRLEPDDVEVQFLGNSNDMTEIPAYKIPYYRREDVIDMRHLNNSSAPIYLKADAERSADAMRSFVNEAIEQAEREKNSAIRQIERMRRHLAHIEAGNLDKVHL